MPDNIVSVRVPDTMLKELKKIASEQHYMDVSDAVRSIVKKKLGEYNGNNDRNHDLMHGLQTIIQQLKNEAKEEQ